MLAVSRDADWIARLRRAAERGGWPFEARPALDGRLPPEFSVVVLDRGALGASPAKAVAAAREAWPAAVVVLSCSDEDLAPAKVDDCVRSGADEMAQKSWSDVRLYERLASLRDRALRGAVRVAPGSALKAEKRSRRAFVLKRGRWSDLRLGPGEFALLWRLLQSPQAPVSRDQLLDELEAVLGRELDAGSVARRVLSLRRALKPWPGSLVAAGGGRYRLTPGQS